jgi:DNA-3-methyladenine glycosylase
MRPLPMSFYEESTPVVARNLLGLLLVHNDRGRTRIGRIVETEAYLGPHDRAAHSSRGPTPRNASMFGDAGHAYLYVVYGIHTCMNIVTEGRGAGAAVLIRAVEPIANCDGRTNGPGLVCRAMGLTRALDGVSLRGGILYVARPSVRSSIRIVSKPRIGVSYAGNWARRLLRFYVKGSPWVSRPL